MAESHGPALVVHNNSVFSEEDFTNITKLAGATKEDKPLKIGKFGIGFCSVYHITDVPSFISGEWLYIFDPTLKHLRRAVKNENQPGKKVKYLAEFLSRTQQLAPYNGLFGFDASTAYNGTMFRFPFRKHISEISSTIYNESLIHQMQNELEQNGKDLLLFLNHVKKITFWSIKNGGVVPAEEISFEKTVNDDQVAKIETSRSECPTKIDYWLISCHREYIQYQSLQKQLTVSSVACKLVYECGVYQVIPVDGSVFCFLPLSMPSIGLPVHISANFAVMSNRRGIMTSDSSEIPLHTVTDNVKKESWNQKLMETAIPQAYCTLLLNLKVMHCKQLLKNYNFFSIWPLSSKLQTKFPWINILKEFYQKVLNEALLYSSSVSDWKKMKEIKFLEEGILVSPKRIKFDSERVLECILKALSISELPIVHLPLGYVNEIKTYKPDMPIMNMDEFMDTFIKNAKLFGSHRNIRNEILYYGLQYLSDVDTDDYLYNLLKCNPCVPCTPKGETLECCDAIVDPDSSIAKLFGPEDSMFPIPNFYSNKSVKEAMAKLGMLKHTLPWSVLKRCAKKVEQCYSTNEEDAMTKINAIIDCIGKNIKRKGMLGREHQSTIDLLRETKFLPVLRKPENYMFSWKGDGHNLCSPLEVTQMDIKEAPFVIGTQRVILSGDCKHIENETEEFLHMQSKPVIEDVLSHFECVITSCSTPSDNMSRALVQEIEKVCRLVYNFLENEIKIQCPSFLFHSEEVITDEDIASSNIEKTFSGFNLKPFIWTGREFVHPSDVCHDWTEEGPYLFKIPDILSQNRHLIKALNIQKTFSAPKLLGTLERMSNDLEEQTVPKNCCSILENILIFLNKLTKIDFQEYEKHVIFLPSEENTLHPVEDLSYNDAQWLIPDEECVFVHQNLWRSTALNLGVKPYRTKFLNKFTGSGSFQGVPFGQREKLTLRIRNILRDHPLDVTVLRELLQNADDAKANKMFVILDKREHGRNCVLSDEWKALQGPALLVWNDKDFTDNDLKGIQKLGLGSKRDDSESIGQFGIGFNAVYHLTDCPSFITRGNTLCVFDPHCRYVPGANELDPGRCYQNISETFWEKFPDLCSPFFLSEPLPNQPEGLGMGSLFRFPLRCTNEQLMSSELIEENGDVLTAEVMEVYLNSWIDDIKDALLFLNHIVSFKFFVIDSEASMFCMKAGYDVQTSRTVYHQKLKEFKRANQCIPFVVAYPLTVNSLVGQRIQRSEKWLIQQGVGDLDCAEQNWPLIEKVIPKHGIAAPLGSSLNGKMFCFLPLPGNSGLPVHINGQFILNSNRQTLWSGQGSDKRMEWNNNIIQAICSSYVRFVTEARHHYVRDNGYRLSSDLQDNCEKYYCLFPYWIKKKGQTTSIQATSSFEEIEMKYECKILAKCFFYKLLYHNCEVLACEVKQYNQFFAQWCCLSNKAEPFQQAYFCPVSIRETVMPILKMIEMKFTCAPTELHRHFRETSTSSIVTPSSVFEFFTNFQFKIFKNGVPCNIGASPFQKIEAFISFLKYITKGKMKAKHREFIKNPLGHVLLLTADNKLQQFKKITHSKYCHLFPKSLSMFLHEACFSIDLDSEYFLSPQSAGFSTVQKLINDNFSDELLRQEVKNTVISGKNLKIIWECIQNDRLFQHYEEEIVKHWALLPAANGYLYSSVSPIKPITPDPSDDQWNDVLSTFRHLGLPIFTKSVDELAEKYCLKLSTDFDEILCALVELHKKEAAFDNLPSSKESSVTLLGYLSRCSFRHNPSILEQIKSLPIFMTVSGNFTTLLEKDVYLWPCDSFCKAGYDKWAPKNDVVFLEKEGSWKQLCQSDFSVLSKNINVQDVYNILIFNKFHLLTLAERNAHLLYIRDVVYPDAAYASKNKSLFEGNKKTAAVKFLTELSELKCLEHETLSNELLTISRFSDHTVKIFNTFPERFLFMSREFRDGNWLKFFRELGLRTKLTFDEYLLFCKNVATGQHEDLNLSSKVLVDYLFSKNAEPWYAKLKYLNQIKEICFVVVNELREYASIKAPCQSRRFFPQLGIHLTSFDEAALDQCASLVWTVKPVVSLPEISETAEDNNVLNKLGITTSPSAFEIYQNIVNISKTKFANFDLFFTYGIHYDGVDLVTVMIENIGRLYEINSEESLRRLRMLKEISCIPVLAEVDQMNSKPVLVNSYQVVKSLSSPLANNSLRPYVCTIPKHLNVISAALDEMGVEQVVSLKHIQYILQFTFECFAGHPTLPNQAQIFRTCILTLADLLLHCVTEEKIADAAKTLTPLYLPSIEDNSLLPISSLLFIDCNRYKRHAKSLNLVGTGYSLFHIPRSFADDPISTLTEKDVCLRLPKEVRPKGLSFVCVESIAAMNEASSPESPLYCHFVALKQLVQLISDVLEKILTKHNHKSKENIKVFIQCLVSLLQEIKVAQSGNLRAVVSINKQEICCIKESYVLLNSSPCILYVDWQASPGGHVLWKDVSHSICLQIAKTLGKELSTFLSFRKELSSCLKCRSVEDLKELLEENEIFNNKLDELDLYESEIIELGAPIPKKWHSYLDSDFNNILCTQEWVGYEVHDGYFIWAMILYPVVDENNKANQLSKRYRIITSKADEEGFDVSMLDLYKLINKKDPKKPVSVDQSSVPTENTSASSEVRMITDCQKLRTLKIEICNELRQIWNLPKKEKALERLYYKYEANPEDANLYKEAFKFLQIQLDRLEDNQEMENPVDNSSDSDSQPLHPASRWRYFYNNLGEKKRKRMEKRPEQSSQDYEFPINVPQTRRDSDEAKRWLRQAECDYEALMVLQQAANGGKKVSCQALFMAHEVMEKGLKAAMYALVGLGQHFLTTHNLTPLANAIHSEVPRAAQLVTFASKMESYYLDTRFPNCYACLQTAPVDVYDPEQSKNISECTAKALELIQDIVTTSLQ